MATEVLYIRIAYIPNQGRMARVELRLLLNREQCGLRALQPIMMVGFNYRRQCAYLIYRFDQMVGLR